MTESHRDSAIIIFARRPLAGHVKSRLAATLGAERAAGIYKRLLDRTLVLADGAPCAHRYLYCDDAQGLRYFDSRLDTCRWELEVQSRGDIGERMRDAFARCLSTHRRAVLIGSDVADAVAADLAAAFHAIQGGGHSAVLGPTADGGYWLLGLSAPAPSVFDGIAWSTDGVARATRERLSAGGFKVVELELRHDVDEERDLIFMSLDDESAFSDPHEAE